MRKLRIFQLLYVCFALSTLSGCGDDDVDPTIVESEYRLDGALFKIESNLFWQRINEPGEENQIRLLQEVSAEGETDMIVLIPVTGDGNLEGTYIFSKTGDIRTYNIAYVRDIKNENSFEWITNGNSGSPLSIVRAGNENGQPVYTLQIEDFELNYGNFDFVGNKWVSLGIKNFSFQYQGIIEGPQ